MPTDPVLLSLAIPTFNRALHLRECLESVRVSILESGEEGRCEVVVSDNASTDETPMVVRAFEPIMKIRYVRQACNIGGHANFRAVAGVATGQYVWVVGDDDRILPAAVRQVIDGLDQGARTVVCNVAVYNRDFSRLVKPRFLRMFHDELYHDPNRVLARIGSHAGYISAMIIDRKAFLDLPLEDYQRYDKEGSCFMYAVFRVMKFAVPVLCIAEPLVLNRGGEGGDEIGARVVPCPTTSHHWWNETFAAGFPDAISALRHSGYSSRSIRIAYAHLMFLYILPRLMYLKTSRIPVQGLVRTAIRHMAESWTVWVLLVPLSWMPGWMLRGLKPCKRLLSRWVEKGD